MSTADETPKKRTIDERIKALTHSLELLASTHKDNEESWTKRWAEGEKRFEAVTRSIEQLTTLALSHEKRINNLVSQ
jgi:hypothetical protein